MLVDDDNGIVAGHGRVMAAQQLGMAEVPTINVGWLTGAQRRAYVIADNQLALNAGWDAEILAHELLDLQGLEFDLSCLGFDAAALAAAMAYMPAAPLENMPGLPDGDRAPFRQMTFTLHDSQEENVTLAINIAKQMGAFVDSPNENSNGNALARICETFITQNGQR